MKRISTISFLFLGSLGFAQTGQEKTDIVPSGTEVTLTATQLLPGTIIPVVDKENVIVATEKTILAESFVSFTAVPYNEKIKPSEKSTTTNGKTTFESKKENVQIKTATATPIK